MATQTKDLVAGDFLIHETPQYFGRKGVTLLAGETDLVPGSLVENNGSDKYQKAGTNVNHVETVAVAGTATAGTMTLTIQRDDGSAAITTGAIAWNATWSTMLAAINTALNTALGTSQVVATDNGGSAANPAFTLTYSGSLYAGKPIIKSVCDVSSLTGATSATTTVTTEGGAKDEVQTITVGGTCSGGTLQLGITNPTTGAVVWTDTIAWNATEATMTASVNTALDNVLGSGQVVCGTIADTAALVMVLTFSGSDYQGRAIAPVQVDAASLTGASTVTVAETTEGGDAGASVDGVLLYVNKLPTSSVDGEGVILEKGPAVLNADRLTYHYAAKSVAVTQLGLAGIALREEPGQTELGAGS